MKLLFLGEEITCARAEKGADWIKIYDEGGGCLGAFSGISDFAGYALEGGEFEVPPKSQLELLRETVDMLVIDSLGV